MSRARDTRDEINHITARLIELGLSDDQKYAILREVGRDRHDVSFEHSGNFPIVLKNVSYQEIYTAIRNERDYNLALADGALIQLHYSFAGDEVISHRLAFFPSPDLTEYQNDPEIYESDVIYAEVLARHVVTTPLRFDFDRQTFQENVHPMAHLTIGQYQNCRIPMNCALTPFRFFEFILSSFYNTAFRNFCHDLPQLGILHRRTITANEARRVHIGVESQD
jgi:hypothetical protein